MSDYIENIPFNEIAVGQIASLKHTLTYKDIELFAILSGDLNPEHIDPKFAKEGIFHKIIAHGMWGGSLLSALLGTQLPGPGTIYLDQSLHFKHPISLGDTIEATVKVKSKDPENHSIDLECTCTNQMGIVVITGMATVIAPVKKIKRKKIKLPNIVLEPQEGRWYQTLTTLTKGMAPLITAVVHPVDAVSLEGAIASAEDRLIIPVLVGPEDKIRAVAKENNINIEPYKLISTKHSHEAAEVAVALAVSGEVEALMKGNIHTDEFMLPIVNKEKGLRTGRRMSHIFALELSYYPKPLFITDAAINIRPHLSAKQDIVQNAIDLFVGLGLGVPKVAIVSAVETINENIPSTLDATALCKMAERGQINGGILDGPLGFDLAISKTSAEVKGIVSEVAGDADIIVVPDVESGNMLYKQMTYLAGSEAAGLVLGAKVPIILTSRGNDVLSRKASSAMALGYARRKIKL